MIQISVLLGYGFVLFRIFGFFNTYMLTHPQDRVRSCVSLEKVKNLRFVEYNQHLNGPKGFIGILDSEKGKLRATSQPTVSPTETANQVRKIADDFRCLTQLAFKVPSTQIQA